jgi:hypothetical protein
LQCSEGSRQAGFQAEYAVRQASKTVQAGTLSKLAGRAQQAGSQAWQSR